MSRIKPWLVSAGSPFLPREDWILGPGAWGRIEAALDRPLDHAARDLLHEIGSDYLSLRQTELGPRPEADHAFEQIDAVEKAAAALRAALQALGANDAGRRVSQLFNYRLRDLREDGVRGIALSFLEDDLRLLVRAAARVRDNLTTPSRLRDPSTGEAAREISTKKSTYAWDGLVAELERFAQSKGVELGVSNDGERTSRFAIFVWAVLKEFPKHCSQYDHSAAGCGKAIERARKRNDHSAGVRGKATDRARKRTRRDG
jgi:hypothetical protein